MNQQGNETIAVATPVNGEVQFFNAEYELFMNAGYGGPGGMEFDSSGNLYITLSELPGVVEILAGSDQPYRYLDSPSGEAPRDVAVCKDGTVYVAQQETAAPGATSVAVYANGSSIATSIVVPSRKGTITNVACDNASRLYVGLVPFTRGYSRVVRYREGARGKPELLPIRIPFQLSCLKVLEAGTIVTTSYSIGGQAGGIAFYENPYRSAPQDVITSVPYPGYVAFDAFDHDKLYASSESPNEHFLQVVSRRSGQVIGVIYLGDGSPDALGVAVTSVTN